MQFTRVYIGIKHGNVVAVESTEAEAISSAADIVEEYFVPVGEIVEFDFEPIQGRITYERRK